MLSQEFFSSFITVYRPYLKLTEPILEKRNIYYGQWLILRDIVKHQPTALIETSHRRAIEKPAARKALKALIENDPITVENSLKDKRQKFLTLTPKGHELYEIVCLSVQKLQQAVVAKTNIPQDQVQETISVMSQIHEILLKEAHSN